MWQMRKITAAGLVAGLVFLILQMVLAAIFGMGPFAPLHLIGAIPLGKSALPPPMAMTGEIAVAAVITHFVVSVLWTTVFAFVLRRFGRIGTGQALVIGAVCGLIVFFIDLYGFAIIWPWFVNARNWYTAIDHIFFGAVAVFMLNRGHGLQTSGAE